MSVNVYKDGELVQIPTIGTIDTLDTVEEVSAVTKKGKVADALVTKNLIESLTANSVSFNLDYQNGQYGWNETSARGADTFHPFSSGKIAVIYDIANGINDITLGTPIPFGNGTRNLTNDANGIGIYGKGTHTSDSTGYYVPVRCDIDLTQYKYIMCEVYGGDNHGDGHGNFYAYIAKSETDVTAKSVTPVPQLRYAYKNTPICPCVATNNADGVIMLIHGSASHEYPLVYFKKIVLIG